MGLDYWSPFSETQLKVLRKAYEHPDGMTLAPKRTAAVLVKRGYAESFGAARRCRKTGKMEVIICITDHGERMVNVATMLKEAETISAHLKAIKKKYGLP
jgi:hypothetical protein